MVASSTDLDQEAPAGTPAGLLSYGRIFDTMLDGVLVAAPDGRYVLANESAAAIFEVPARDLLVSLTDFPDRFGLRERDGTRAVPLAVRALRGEVVAPTDRLISTPTGGTKTIRASAGPMRDNHGRIIGAVLVIGDITDTAADAERARQHAANLQKAHDERAAALRDAEYVAELLELGDAFLEIDACWRIVRVNRNQEKMSGRPRAESVGRSLWEVWPDLNDPSSQYRREYHRCMEDRVPVQFEDYFAPLGMWTGVTAYPTSAGGIAVFVRDISARKRAEVALQEREAELRLAQRIAHVGSWSWTVGTDCLEASEEVFRIYGRDPGLPIPANDSDELRRHYTPEGWARRAAAFQRALSDGQPWERDEEIVRLDGSRRWVHFRGEPERDTSGRIVKLRGTIQDITERKLAEDAVREADARKTEFLGVLSHELRNPLAPIRNSVYLMEQLPADSPQASRARQVIRRQSEHLTRLVDDLLDVTRISRGKVQLHREVVDLRNIVRRTVEDHRASFEENELELHLDVPAAPVWIDADATRIGQVIENLLANASKFTPAGGETMVLLRRRNDHAEVTVRDTGIGMEPRQVDRMFEPFVQEDRSLARTRGGLGLGLALSKGLVELHGGTITARSDGPGRGSDFVITLPTAARPASTAAAITNALGSGRHRRVLIIEDNLDAARTLADVLSLVGHETTIARDGTTGIALARKLKPDVVLCDVGLPDMDGYEVARTLRADGPLGHTRLIALSGYAQPEDKERARQAGFDAHVAKPATLNELAEWIA